MRFGIYKIQSILIIISIQIVFAQSSISSVYPTQNEPKVNNTTDIIITFTEDIDSATLNNNTIRVYGSQKGLYTSSRIIYASDIRTVTFDPDSIFNVGEVVNISLTNGIHTSKGDSIRPLDWSFIVAVSGDNPFFVETSRVNADFIHWMSIGDLDNDGDLDLVTANGDISIISNDGNGNYMQTSTVRIKDDAQSLITGDFDNDGFIDLATVNYNEYSESSSVSITLNSDSGIFTESFTLSVDGDLRHIIGGDFDNDGDLDLGVGNALTGYLLILKNNGDGNFVQFTELYLGGVFYSLATGDFDNDGDLDIIAGLNNGKIEILKNNGNGVFLLTLAFNVNRLIGKLTKGDFNGDGNLDLAVLNGNNSVSVLLNDGNINFTQTVISDVGIYVSPIITNDMDGDGDLDLVVACKFGGRSGVSILVNDGNGNFIKLTELFDLNLIFSLTTGDLDNDGDLDLAVAHNDYISIFKNVNNLPPPSGPRGIITTAGSGQVQLDWLPNSEFDLSHYNIYRATSNDSISAVFIASVYKPTTVFIDSNVISNTTYYYWVSAVDSAGNESNLSTGSNATPVEIFAPQNLTAKNSAGQVILNWLPNSENDLSHYNVYRNTSYESTIALLIDSVFKPTTFYIDSNALGQPTYFYWVSAVDSAGHESMFSNVCSVDFIVKSLTIGNKYYFEKEFNYPYDPPIFSYYQQTVVGDTVIQGKTYAIIQHSNSGKKTFERSDSTKLYRFSDGEKIVYDMTMEDGYILPNTYYFADWEVVNNDTTSIFGINKHRLVIVNNHWDEYYGLEIRVFHQPFGQTEYSDAHDEMSTTRRLIAANINGVFYGDTSSSLNTMDEDKLNIPETIILNQNYPNPFNSLTVLSYTINKPDFVKLEIHDILGRKLQTFVEKTQEPGTYFIRFNANDYPSGIYFYTLHVGKYYAETKKMVLLR